MAQSSKDGWIDWRNSESRSILLLDLESGVLPLDITAQEAWEIYALEPVFIVEGVVFDQFKARLAGHRKQVRRDHAQRQHEEAALVHDRQLYPRAFVNHRAEPVFDMSEAKTFLEQDVECGKPQTMTMSALHHSRQAYLKFRPDIFRQRVYQEQRRQKFLVYLEQKRVLKEEAAEKRRKKVREKARQTKEKSETT